jgi:hypothetical protein
MAARLLEERQRREERQHAERIAEQLHAPLAAMAVSDTRRVLVTPQLLLTAAYLVPRDRTEAFRHRVDALGASHPDLRVLCTGPWPPYHFVPSIVEPTEAGA